MEEAIAQKRGARCRRPEARVVPLGAASVYCRVAAPGRSLAALLLLFLACGCGSPNHANIELRKRVQTLETQVSTLETQNQALRRMADARQAAGPTTREVPPDLLNKLYVAYGVKLARLTGGAEVDRRAPGDGGIRVYAAPTDENGDTIQAAGSFVIEAFDLEEKGDTRLGHWEFSTLEARKTWRALLLDASYVLTCPWQKQPRHPTITLRVTFTDELTHASFPIQRTITVTLPAGH